MADLFDRIVGQEGATGILRAAVAAPVHAYLLVGPAGTGKVEAARLFAASLLCPRGGCGECDDCRLALSGRHPDLVVRERSGAFISVDDAREVARMAGRSPLRSARQVVLLTDFHLVDKAAPALLKTLEEPPASTVFVVLADHMAPELATIASRCAVVPFRPLGVNEVIGSLIGGGLESATALAVAQASNGRLDRARLLAADPGFKERYELWRTVPVSLDGSGARAAALVDELLAGCEQAVEPVRAAQADEVRRLTESARAAGERGLPGRREIEERHRREQRRARTDDLRAGLGALSRAYLDRVSAAFLPARSVRACLDAVDAVARAGESLIRNPNETLLIQGLLVRLSALAPDVPAASEGALDASR